MIKIYKKLTKDQKARNVIFSSTLSSSKRDDELGSRTHEVYKPTTQDGWREAMDTIKRLKDDSFFNDRPWKYNVIRN